VNPDPTAEELAEISMMAAQAVRLFGIEPRTALLSHSNFGSHTDGGAQKMKRAVELINQRAPELEVEGEMTADAALDVQYRQHVFPNSRLRAQANLLVMPGIDAAHISFNLARLAGNAVTIGPILLGMARPVHILTPSATVRRIANMTAIAAVDAQIREAEKTE
jgi:malate dehydrogenase (oxaloacetate-decarboxylating)(NADP+)